MKNRKIKKKDALKQQAYDIDGFIDNKTGKVCVIRFTPMLIRYTMFGTFVTFIHEESMIQHFN